MPKVGIVVDSTCDMTVEELRALNVELAPLRVTFGEKTYLDAVEMTSEEFYRELAKAEELPKTSQPSPQQFAVCFDRCVEQGCDSIISLSLSSAISGTYQTSTIVAKDYDVPIYCIDTKNVTHGLSTLVLAACKLRDKGLSGEEIADSIGKIALQTQLLFVIYTMDNLVKGGRAGRSAGLAASLLDIKPILTLDETGVIAPFKKCKGKKKAVAELAKYVAKCSKELGPLYFTLINTTDPEDISLLREAFAEAGVDGEEIHHGSNGAVIGTYVPEACGVAFYPQNWDI